MPAIWHVLVRYAPYAYLTRFPLLLAVFLVGFVPVALVWVKPLFRSMLIQDFSGVLSTTFATWLAAFTVMATRRVTLLHGALRFDTEPLIEHPTHIGVREATIHAFVAVPLIATVGWLSARENHLAWLAVPAVVGGTVLAAAAVLAAVALQAWIIAPRGDVRYEMSSRDLTRGSRSRTRLPAAAHIRCSPLSRSMAAAFRRPHGVRVR